MFFVDKDINEIFEDLLFTEDNLATEAFKDGFVKGQTEGNLEGYHLGYHRGAEIGAELGYYLGIANLYLSKFENDQAISDRKIENLTLLIDLIQNFPKLNADNIDIIAEFDKIKILFKKTCALLKIDAAFPEVDQLSF